MGSQTMRVPFIDFSESDLKQDSPLWNSIRSQVIDAATEYGCFEASFPSVTQQLHTQVFDQLKELFELPKETKQRLPRVKHLPGYITNPLIPIYQSIGFTDTHVIENVESRAKILWPQGNTNFCEILKSYTEKVTALCRMLRQMIAESFGTEKHLEEQNKFSFYAVRASKYDAPKSDEPQIGLGTHIDMGYLGILSQNQINGFQVEAKNGSWIDVNPRPHNFIVLFGEAMRVWTNDRLHAVPHRVMMSGEQARYSFEVSANPKVGYRFMTPKELIDEDNSARCEPYELMETIRKLYPNHSKITGSTPQL